MLELTDKIDLANFSWSLLREHYFHSCRRAYIFYYHLARGGNNAYASTATCLIYRLKYLCRVERWLQRLFFQAIRQTFTSASTPTIHSDLADFLIHNCLKNFHRDCQMLKAKCWRNDPKLPNLTEIYYREQIISHQTFLDWQQILQHYLEQFIANPLFSELSAMNSLCWRHFDTPTAVSLGELKLWLNPLLIWRKHDYAHILLPDNRYSAENTLLKIAAASLKLSQMSGLPPEQQQIYLLFPENGDIVLQRPNLHQLTKSWSKIIQNSAEMRNFEYNTAKINQLPPGTETYCPQCNFREICQSPPD